jgi:hypothetical protein
VPASQGCRQAPGGPLEAPGVDRLLVGQDGAAIHHLQEALAVRRPCASLFVVTTVFSRVQANDSSQSLKPLVSCSFLTARIRAIEQSH